MLIIVFVAYNWKALISFENAAHHMPTSSLASSSFISLPLSDSFSMSPPSVWSRAESVRRTSELQKFWETAGNVLCMNKNLTSILSSNYLLNSNNSNKNGIRITRRKLLAHVFACNFYKLKIQKSSTVSGIVIYTHTCINSLALHTLRRTSAAIRNLKYSERRRKVFGNLMKLILLLLFW